MRELEQLQQWYAAQCDGDWEHTFGVSIATLDNPGWTISVDLEGTELEGLAYSAVNRTRSETEWIQCAVTDRQWCGAGGPTDLEELIREFLLWAGQQS